MRQDGRKVVYSLPGQPPEMTVIVNTNTADGPVHVWHDGVEVPFAD